MNTLIQNRKPRGEQYAPYIIPFFIPHRGCPHRCIFCNQQKITGEPEDDSYGISPASVSQEIHKRLSLMRQDRKVKVQVAFYGGSFTGIALELQDRLLGAVQPFIKAGLVDAIRISTRPDYIDPNIASFLKDHHVDTVELGVQSMSPEVLMASGRGHSAEDTEKAIAFLRQAGVRIGAQLMIGLPGDSSARLFAGIKRLIIMAPDFVRIYPVLVIKNSGLADLFRQGRYQPLSLTKAVALTAKMKKLFDRHDIRVVRMGLQPTESLAENVVAGPYHPSFGELVLSRTLFNKVRRTLAERKRDALCRIGPTRLSIAAADQSLFRGPGNCHVQRLQSLGLLHGVEVVFDPLQERQTALISQNIYHRGHREHREK